MNETIAGASGSTFALAATPGHDSTTSLSFTNVGDFQTLNLGLASGENSIGQDDADHLSLFTAVILGG